MERQIVVAKHREWNISWISNLTEAVVYTKGKEIANYGREASTYLHHIIRYYDNLADYTIFCQADPFPHDPNFLESIQDFRHEYKSYGIHCEECSDSGELRVSDACERFLGYKLSKYSYIAGAQFCVSRTRIQQRSVDFYQLLLKFCREDAMSPWILERLWAKIFVGVA